MTRYLGPFHLLDIPTFHLLGIAQEKKEKALIAELARRHFERDRQEKLLRDAIDGIGKGDGNAL